jgi:glycosyltransferase involved in cell wall biosynthesis
VRTLHLQVAWGYSPEAKVQAQLFRHRRPDSRLLAYAQRIVSDPSFPERFGAEARARVLPVDVGWRAPWDPRSPTTRLASVARLGASFPRLTRHAAAYRPDVIYSSQQRWDIGIASALAFALRRPHVVHVHYAVGPWLGLGVVRQLRTSAHVIAISDFIKSQLIEQGVRPERVTRVHNPVTPPPAPAADVRDAVRAELGLPADATLVGEIARISPFKGQLDAIDAFARAAADRPDAHLLIVGGGDGNGLSEGDVRARADRTGLGRRIHVLGGRAFPEAMRILAALDVFIHPSVMEPFGLAVGEAAAAGKPVVAYADGAAPEIVLHEQSGLLAPTGDVPSLAASLRRLIDDRDLARQMGRAGARHATAAFSPPRLGAQLDATLRAVARRSLDR